MVKTSFDDDGDGVPTCDVWCGAATSPQQEISASITIPVAQGGDEHWEVPLLVPPVSCMTSIFYLGTMLLLAATLR